MIHSTTPIRTRLCRSKTMAVVVMPMDAVAKVWVRLIQLQCMRPRDRHVLLGRKWLTQHGVTRYAKYRALRKLEAAGLIRAVRSDHRGPRVEILARVGRSQNRTGGRSQNRTGS